MWYDPLVVKLIIFDLSLSMYNEIIINPRSIPNIFEKRGRQNKKKLWSFTLNITPNIYIYIYRYIYLMKSYYNYYKYNRNLVGDLFCEAKYLRQVKNVGRGILVRICVRGVSK